jgi:hypothetical protein
LRKRKNLFCHKLIKNGCCQQFVTRKMADISGFCTIPCKENVFFFICNNPVFFRTPFHSIQQFSFIYFLLCIDICFLCKEFTYLVIKKEFVYLFWIFFYLAIPTYTSIILLGKSFSHIHRE